MPQRKTSKQEIIRKSTVVFREKGYHQTSISDLKKACGISHAANFYYYFSEGKKQLMLEVLNSVHAYFTQRIFPLAYEEEIPPKERMIRMMEKLKKVFSGGKGGCLMANTTLENAHSDPDLLNTVRSFFDELVKSLVHILKARFEEEEAQDKAEQIVQDVEGGLILMQVYNDEKYLDKALQRAFKLLGP